MTGRVGAKVIVVIGGGVGISPLCDLMNEEVLDSSGGSPEAPDDPGA